MSKKSQALLLCVAGFGAAVGLLIHRIQNGTSSIILDFLTIIAFIAGFVLLDIHRLRPGKGHSWRTLLLQYATQRMFLVAGSVLQWRFDKMTRNCSRQQEKLLMSMLEANGDTLCGRHYNISGIKSVSDFIQHVPLTVYGDYQEFIQQVSESGTSDVMFPGKADYIVMTSGTTSGKSKRYPKSTKIMKKKSGVWWLFLQKKLLDVLNNNLLRRWLAVRVYPKFTFSKSGLKEGPISGMTADTQMSFFATPFRGGDISTEEEAIYINLLFGIAEEHIGNMFFPTSTLALTFFKMLETKWKDLCNDLENGHLSESIEIPDKWRKLFNDHLKGGNRDRALYLRAEFEKGFDGIVSRIWPTCPVLFCITTGTFRLQAKILKDKYMGSVPIISPFHAGSEGLYGFNFDLKEMEATYIAMTPVTFFEFIPEENVGEEQPKTCLAHQVEVGKIYEIVVTTWDGLYRYRTEDLVLIDSFQGTIPKYTFFQRTGDILTAFVEKVPETFLSSAIAMSAKQWPNKTISHYTSVENIHVENVQGNITGKRFYMVFIEIQEDDVRLTSEECNMVDAELIKLHQHYAGHRGKNTLEPVKLCQVQCGTFLRVRDAVLASNPHASCMQYKPPRIIRRPELLSVLIDNIISPV